MSEAEKEELLQIKKDSKKVVIPITIDFDGTVVHHAYPRIGKENEHCVEIMKRWIEEYNVGFILNTMRSGALLMEAVKWFNDREIPLYGIGTNPSQKNWTDSPKAYGYFSIDDINVGCPLIEKDGERPRVDWMKIKTLLEPKLKQIHILMTTAS